VEELAARLVEALVGMGAEVVALGLQQVGRQARAAVAVEVGQGRAEAGIGMPIGRRPSRRPRAARPAWALTMVRFFEERVQQQVAQARIVVEGVLDLAEEDTSG
jgi:hypothetical protein